VSVALNFRAFPFLLDVKTMILLLWGLLFLIAVIFLILGYAIKETSISDVLIPVCWVFLFALSVGMFLNQLQIPTGQTDTTSYIYSTQGNSTTLNQTILTSQDIYTTYETEEGLWKILGSRFFGFFLAMISVSGFIIFWMEFKSRGEF